jgi:plasmid stabilization system protein ParE
MQRFRVIFTEDADADLENIVVYLSRFSTGAARKYYEEIRQKANSLAELPERCPFVSDDELRAQGFRWLFVHNYTIFYTVDNDARRVHIRRLMYAGRDYTALL